MKYKLIKTYPGGPNTIGLEIHKNGSYFQSEFTIENVEHFHTNIDPSEYPEFWELIEEPTYKILEFLRIVSNEKMILFKNNLYGYEDPEVGHFTLDEMLNKGVCVESGDFKIVKIKRLSDGEIFEINDFVKLNLDWGENCKLTNFIIRENGDLDFQITQGLFKDYYGESFGHDINKWIKVNLKPFTDEDGEKFGIGDEVWWITPENKIRYTKSWDKGNGICPGLTYFLNKERCFEYLKKISENEISNLFKQLKNKVMYFPGTVDISLEKQDKNIDSITYKYSVN